MATRKEHWRIKILDGGADCWHWHRVGNRPAHLAVESVSMTAARHRRRLLPANAQV